MTLPKGSQQAAKLAGTNLGRLQALLRDRRMTPPAKDATGRYLWTDEDIERARFALARDRRKRRVEAAVNTPAMAG